MNLDALDSIKIAAEQPEEIQIFASNGEPFYAADGVTPCTVSVVGSDAPRYVAKRQKILRRASTLRRQITPEENVAGRIEIAVAGVVAWSGWELDSKPAPLTEANVKQLLAASEGILSQVEAAIAGHGAGPGFFTSTSSTRSPSSGTDGSSI